jgi:hypothetical protein
MFKDVFLPYESKWAHRTDNEYDDEDLEYLYAVDRGDDLAYLQYWDKVDDMIDPFDEGGRR